MMGTVFTRVYELEEPDLREILRYAGDRGAGSELLPSVHQLLSELPGILTPKVCYTEYPLKITGENVDLGFACVSSRLLATHLSGCSSVIAFAATVGARLDRKIMRLGVESPVKQLVMQAIGTERVECLCDTFCLDMKNEYSQKGKKLTSRFSPGYSDLPLSLQKDMLGALNSSKTVGVTLNESLLMSPSKSVSAVIGIKDET